MTRLPPVLSEQDLPLPELHAARLDGELVTIEQCFTPIDVVVGRPHRALTLRAVLDERLIVERTTAAWVWGATARPGTPLRSCVPAGTRARVSGTVWNAVREVSISPAEFVIISGLRVTTPLRTLIDLARAPGPFDDDAARIAATLATIGGVTLAVHGQTLERIRSLPGGRTACARLRSVLNRS